MLFQTINLLAATLLCTDRRTDPIAQAAIYNPGSMLLHKQHGAIAIVKVGEGYRFFSAAARSDPSGALFRRRASPPLGLDPSSLAGRLQYLAKIPYELTLLAEAPGSVTRATTIRLG